MSGMILDVAHGRPEVSPTGEARGTGPGSQATRVLRDVWHETTKPLEVIHQQAEAVDALNRLNRNSCSSRGPV